MPKPCLRLDAMMGRFIFAGTLLKSLSKRAFVARSNGQGYPATRKEFEGYLSFRTHDLDILLHLSGTESKIKTLHLAEWSIVATWDPNVRYRPIDSASSQDTDDMIKSTRVILRAL
jgi:hypothetical protein